MSKHSILNSSPFSSFATGGINEGSDIDSLDKVQTLMDINTFKIPIEPVGYTPRNSAKGEARHSRAYFKEIFQMFPKKSSSQFLKPWKAAGIDLFEDTLPKLL